MLLNSNVTSGGSRPDDAIDSIVAQDRFPPQDERIELENAVNLWLLRIVIESTEECSYYR